MNTHRSGRASKLFVPHPNLDDEVNANLVRSDIEGGVYLNDLSEGAVLEVETQNHEYTIVVRGRGTELISGHPQYCPDPVAVRIAGSTWGGSMLKARFCRTRNAPGIPAPELSNDYHVTNCGYSECGLTRDQRLSGRHAPLGAQAEEN